MPSSDSLTPRCVVSPPPTPPHTLAAELSLKSIQRYANSAWLRPPGRGVAACSRWECGTRRRDGFQKKKKRKKSPMGKFMRPAGKAEMARVNKAKVG